MRRVVVIGCAGAGKTTLSRALAARLGVPHVERDELGELGGDDYRRRVGEVVAGDAWVFDGAPYYVDAVVYPRADTVVALDYARVTVLRRAAWRALQTRRSSGLRWAWKVWAERRREVAALDLPHAEIVRLRTPRDARAWLRRLAPGATTSTRPSARSSRP
jgi:adenylate kinase family enzyme